MADDPDLLFSRRLLIFLLFFLSSSSFVRDVSAQEGSPGLPSPPGSGGVEKQILRTEEVEPKILTIKLKNINKDVSYEENGDIVVLEKTSFTLRLFGLGLTNASEVKFITHNGSYGDACVFHDQQFQTASYPVYYGDAESVTVSLTEGLPSPPESKVFYLCLKATPDGVFIHQGAGTEETLHVRVYSLLLPIWLMILILITLLCLSGLFSGLNLGLMALDQTELKIVQNTGTDDEKEYANKITPVRAHGNFLLCSLLLGNVLVNNSLTILLDTLTSGIVAIIGATMGIVIFGEIIPQAICSRHGLAVGAYTIWLTKFFMVLTFPLSYPISKILDRILGTEIGTVYNKERLMELLRVTNEYNDLEKDEVNIVTGALVYKRKTVRDVMTKLEDCYLLKLSTVMNFEALSEIREQGYSRIPVYDGKRNNIVHVLFAKDLMFVDPDDNMPLSALCEFYNNDVNFVFHDTPLNVMFNEFKSGDKGHMAFVQDINTEGDGDPFYETCGLVTLEDIIEEIIQQEIVDETDVVTDNKTKKRRNREGGWKGKEGNLPFAIGHKDAQQIQISPQLTLAVFQYLSTCIEPFKPSVIAEPVLKRLLSVDIFREFKIKQAQKGEVELISRGKPIDYFILLIEGKVEVNIGKEGLVFEGGPFTYFGVQTLGNTGEDSNTLPSSPNLNNSKSVIMTPGSIHSSNSQSELGQSSATPNMRSSIRKASTHNSIDYNSLSKRNSSAEIHHHYKAHFVPDYTVKALTDVLYLKIRNYVYVGAIRASNMLQRRQLSSAEFAEKELDKLLERVSEDEHSLADSMDAPIMAKTPEIYSPDKISSSSFRRDSIRNSLNAALRKTFNLGGPRGIGESRSFDRSASQECSNSIRGGGAVSPSLPEKNSMNMSAYASVDDVKSNTSKDRTSPVRQSPPPGNDLTTTLLPQENTS